MTPNPTPDRVMSEIMAAYDCYNQSGERNSFAQCVRAALAPPTPAVAVAQPSDAVVSAIIFWLEANQPDVFKRGLWDAIGDTSLSVAPPTGPGEPTEPIKRSWSGQALHREQAGPGEQPSEAASLVNRNDTPQLVYGTDTLAADPARLTAAARIDFSASKSAPFPFPAVAAVDGREASEQESFDVWWAKHPLRNNEVTSMDVWAAWQARAALTPSPGAAGDEPSARYFPFEFEVWQGEELCASSSGSREEALRDAMHYASQYGQDGPVRVFEVTRTLCSEHSVDAPVPPLPLGDSASRGAK